MSVDDEQRDGMTDRCNGCDRLVDLDSGAGCTCRVAWFGEDEEEEPPFRLQQRCALCGATFFDSAHTCPVSRQIRESVRETLTGSVLGDVAATAATRATMHGREAPDGLDMRLQRD